MENYIDLINAYVDKTLSSAETLAFENRLETDSEFNILYEEHLSLLRGMERVALLEEINKAKKTYIKNKWLKYIAITAAVILVSIVAYNLISNSQNEGIQHKPNEDSVEIIEDSTLSVAENDSIKTYVVVELIKELREDKALTKAYGGIETFRDTLIKKELGRFTKADFESKFPEIKDFKIENDTIFIHAKLLETMDKARGGLQKRRNDSSRPKTEANATASFFKSVEKKAQVFSLDTEKDTEVTLKEGTIISIPANAFIDAETLNEVKGNVTLEATEYYELSDMLLANLSTKSGNSILETGGMLYLEAFKNGLKLKLKPGKDITIVFNNSGKERMQLFYGEKRDGQINWSLDTSIVNTETEYVIDELTGQIESTESIADVLKVAPNDEITKEPEEEGLIMDFRTIEEVPIYPGCETVDKADKNECMNQAITKFINRKMDLPESVRLTPRVYTIHTAFEIDKNGYIGNIQVRASRRELANEITRVLELLPRLEPGYYKGNPVKVKYTFPITYRVTGAPNDRGSSRPNNAQRDSIVTVRSDKKFQKDIESKDISEISNKELERYTFASTNLGWINCDRFVRSQKQKIDYKIKIKDAEGANIKLIFKSISSILSGKNDHGQIDFGKIPMNEDVILLAIKKDGNRLYLGKKETTTKVISEMDLEFKAVTLQELKAELMKLNRQSI